METGTIVMYLHVTGVALAGILAVLHSCLDLKATIGGSQYHHILYFLTPAMKPRMLMTVDKDMNLLPVSVRVGQAVDVVAQVNKLHIMLVKTRLPTVHLLKLVGCDACFPYSHEFLFKTACAALYTADHVCRSNVATYVVWMSAARVSSTACCAHGELTVLIVQAGRPKTISGFQTHTTPVLLSVGERAELATQKYLAINPVLEGIVILQENPEYIDSQE